MKVVALCASARPGGNSELLAASLLEGAAATGHETEQVHLREHVTALLGDCRTCRRADGCCGIGDGYERLLLDTVITADAIVYATPLYWYGVSGQLKAFFDRLFCYTSDEHPRSAEVMAGLAGARAALLISAEESYPGAVLGVVHQLQEFTRYVGQELLPPVVGIGNSRREVARDPAKPLDAAHQLGRRLFDARVTDYRMQTLRPSSVWSPRSGHLKPPPSMC